MGGSPAPGGRSLGLRRRSRLAGNRSGRIPGDCGLGVRARVPAKGRVPCVLERGRGFRLARHRSFHLVSGGPNAKVPRKLSRPDPVDARSGRAGARLDAGPVSVAGPKRLSGCGEYAENERAAAISSRHDAGAGRISDAPRKSGDSPHPAGAARREPAADPRAPASSSRKARGPGGAGRLRELQGRRSRSLRTLPGPGMGAYAGARGHAGRTGRGRRLLGFGRAGAAPPRGTRAARAQRATLAGRMAQAGEGVPIVSATSRSWRRIQAWLGRFRCASAR